MTAKVKIREIKEKDNLAVAHLIREVMTEWGAVGEGYSIEDPEVDNMYEAYANEGAIFFVIEKAGKIIGCGGFAALKGEDIGVCELQKMYFYPELRGLGWGRKLLEKCLKIAKGMGYKKCYLETCSSMTKAVYLYQKNGFEALDTQMGNTGHTGCDAFFIKELF